MSDSHHTGHGRCGSCGDAGAVARMRDAERLKIDFSESSDDESLFDYDECESCWRGCCGYTMEDEDFVDHVLAAGQELRVPLRVPLVDVARLS